MCVPAVEGEYLFGIDDDPAASIRSVKAGLEMLEAIDKMKPYLEAMYARAFDIGIGLHYGEAVIGTVGSASKERLTAIGDTVNVASRIEAANKEADTRLLISEELHERLEDDLIVEDFIRVRLRGTSGRKTLYEISGIEPAVLEELSPAQEPDGEVRRYAGLDWVRLLPEADLRVGESKVVERPEFDILVIRTEDSIHAVNNACPHLNLPLNDSEVTADGGIVCRWHKSCFDLATGEIRSWCEGLQTDGTSEGMEMLGNVSKNRRPMTILPTRVDDGDIWVALD